MNTTAPAIFTDVDMGEEFVLKVNHQAGSFVLRRVKTDEEVEIADLGFKPPPRPMPSIAGFIACKFVKDQLRQASRGVLGFRSKVERSSGFVQFSATIEEYNLKEIELVVDTATDLRRIPPSRMHHA